MTDGRHRDTLFKVPEYQWNAGKDEQLKKERNVCFQDVVDAIQNGNLLATIDHPNKKKYLNQRIFIVKINEYIYIVPFIENEIEIFLKTIIPSRKAKKIYEI